MKAFWLPINIKKTAINIQIFAFSRNPNFLLTEQLDSELLEGISEVLLVLKF